jgi:Tfp pilus assembly protein PilV
MGIRRAFGRLSTRLSKEEGGWLIVEVMISAVVLVIAGLAIFNGLDGASKASGANRNRSEAAALAQQDQERLRSFESSGLSNYHHVGQVTVGGLSYTVTSRAQWVRDTSGTVSCTLDSSQAQYLLITSSVSDPTNRNQPVVAQSLVAPHVGDFSSNTGTAAIQLVDRNGNGVPGINVGLNEPPSPSDTTNSAGCVVFGYLPVLSPGPYHAVFSQPGYVDLLGNNSIGPTTTGDDGSTTLVAGQTSLTQFSYDQAGAINPTFVNSSGAAARTTGVSDATGLSVTNTGIPKSPPQRYFPVGTPLNTLFPFTSAYSVWAGACAGADPSLQSQTAPTALVTPGGTTPVTIKEPTVTVTLKKSGTLYTGNHKLTIVGTGSGCTTTFTDITGTTGTGVVAADLPYGPYTVCADDRAGHRLNGQTVTNNVPGGVAKTMDIQTSSSGSC